MLTKEFAMLLNGRSYRHEITREEEAAAKAAGLVVVFGASDDLMEFRGAIDDEVGASNGGEAFVTLNGLLAECESECKHYATAKRAARLIEAHWCKVPPFAWTITTDVPHEVFELTDGGEPWCRGIVFALADVGDPC